MKNPWLKIPASDYENHMSLPEVAQAQALSNLMALALEDYTPASLAVIGCTTGNGFEHIDPTQTHRVVGVDINSDYLFLLEKKFAGKIPNLELINADVAAPDFQINPVSMVFAGLIFEYVDVEKTLINIYKSMLPGAIFLAVLQLPSPESSLVTVTPYKSLGLLAPIMNLVLPSELSNICDIIGLKQINTNTIPLKKGKAFFVGLYRKNSEQTHPSDHPHRRLHGTGG